MSSFLKIFKNYKDNRKKLNSDTKIFYFKKLLNPLFITAPLFYISNKYFLEINHSSISTALVSINAIIVAFLVFSMTILLTKENLKNIPNTNIKYMDILINNTEVLTIFSTIGIMLNLVYMFLSNLTHCSIENWDIILNIISFFSTYMTLFIIKIAIDDLLFLSESYKSS